MKIKPIIKKTVAGGLVASMVCSNFAPLSKLNLSGFSVDAAIREIHNYQKIREYNNNFSDVNTSDWFYSNVAKAYSYDLINGKSSDTFDPKGNITIAEAITIAAKLNSYALFGNISPSIQMEADPWYTLFVVYAEAKQIISKDEFKGEYTRAATRDELAHIFANTLPDNGYYQINVVTKLPDIDASNPYYNDVVKLYNAGIISGNDSLGTFTPKANITRAEVASIASRLALPSTRVVLTFCQSIARPLETDVFEQPTQLGTEVYVPPEVLARRNGGSGSTSNTNQSTQSTNTSSSTNSNSNNNSNTTTKKKDEYDDDNRYNYNHTWDYKTNSFVDPNKNSSSSSSSSNNSNKNSSNNNNSNSSNKNNVSSSSSQSSNKDEESNENRNKYEFDSNGYFTYDSFRIARDFVNIDGTLIDNLSIQNHYKEYIKDMEVVSRYYPKGKDSYELNGKTYSDYYDFMHAYAIALINGEGFLISDGKIHDNFEEYQDDLDKARKEEEQYEIEHYGEGTLKLVNEARAEEGLPSLTLDPNLVEAAEIRAKELAEYYSHTRPDGRNGNTVIDDLDIPCTVSGENIAQGTSTVANIQAWLGSSGHKAQIMNKRYQTYGAAEFKTSSGSVYKVQIFNRETPFDD